MKKRMFRALASTAFVALLCVSLAATAFAANNPFAAMEAKSRQAVDAAIAAGTVPAGTTMYDCMFTEGEDGVTRVIQYRDKDGNWIDIETGQKKNDLPDTPIEKPDASTQKLSEDILADYAAEMFRLVNEAREDAGLEPLERDGLLDEAAMIRASEVTAVYDAGGAPHTRPDGTSIKSLLNDMGVNGKRCGENIVRERLTPQAAMQAWMDSNGHRKNILREDYGSIGIGVYQRSDGKLDWIQIFMLK